MSAIRNPHLIVTVKCAAPGCVNLRREANHWFLITIEPGNFLCRPFLPELGLNESDLPACGQACAQRLFERFLARTASHSSRKASTTRHSNSPDERHIHLTTGHLNLESKMHLHELNHPPIEPSISQHSSDPVSNQAAQPNLASCVYIGLHCSNCGDVRQALSDLPAGENTLCPQCGTLCCFLRLGTGLTSRELPFHELSSSYRQAITAVGERPEIAPHISTATTSLIST